MFSGKKIQLLGRMLLLIPAVGIPLALLPFKNAGQPDFYSLPRTIYTVLEVAAFYINVFYLFPRLFQRNRIKLYLFSILGIALLITGIHFTALLMVERDPPGILLAQATIKFFVSAMILATGTSYCLIRDTIRARRLEKEQLRTELSFLRSQVSPHFMFNTLNSMVALARKKSDKLEPALIELSNLMHYMLYESDQEQVSLSKEINYIQSYIDLQTLRFGNQVRIICSMQRPAEERYIEPMLLIPLIENAFKHGIGLIEDPEINIQLQVSKEDVSLLVRNRYNHLSTEIKDKVAGIGLANLERRLDLLYPGRHDLMAEKNGHWFKASLKIQLHDQMFGS